MDSGRLDAKTANQMKEISDCIRAILDAPKMDNSVKHRLFDHLNMVMTSLTKTPKDFKPNSALGRLLSSHVDVSETSKKLEVLSLDRQTKAKTLHYLNVLSDLVRHNCLAPSHLAQNRSQLH